MIQLQIFFFCIPILSGSLVFIIPKTKKKNMQPFHGIQWLQDLLPLVHSLSLCVHLCEHTVCSVGMW